ncbi:MAG: DUF937 domain-containing protein [Anaerolineales bacterium]|nr:DUF937 domain-containing protein [Anaerolineales bacterium]
MATLLDELSKLLNHRRAEQLEKMLGVKEHALKQGVQTAGAVLLGTANIQAATPAGAEELLASLNLDKEIRTDVMEAIAEGHGYPILNFLFGVGLPKVSSWLRDTAGMEVEPFLPVTAPMFMHVLQDAVRAQKLDGAGLTAYLVDQEKIFARAQPQLASQINAALDLGQNTVERAERNIERFTPEEWDTLSRVPALAGHAVMLAAWSGPRGLQKEFDALQTAMAECGRAHDPDSLVGLVGLTLTGPAQLDALGVTQANAMSLTRDGCLDALAILNDKATHEEILAYKEFIVAVAQRVAQAARDGGIFSVGGKPVSADEQAMLDLIAAALAYTP